ncbi:hypothetical protein JCM10914_3119 [Paenibacillus sp. JCM 10914]|nr:hypothetical protein JCM10914_3119 [Paenibacillus sp. JCM 10914]
MALVAGLARLPKPWIWRSLGLFGMVIGMFLTAILSARIGWLSALHPVIALIMFSSSLKLIREARTQT